MNILPKKNWHVRKKENIARVRRDEAQAAELEKERLRKIQVAEKEARVQLLKEKSRSLYPNQSIKPDVKKEEKDCAEEEQTGHINFFKELEDGLVSFTGTNKDYEKEKKEEGEKYEKQIGYLTYLGQDTVELTGNVSWFNKVPERLKNADAKSESTEVASDKKGLIDPLKDIRRYLGTNYSASSSVSKQNKEDKDKDKERKRKREDDDDIVSYGSVPVKKKRTHSHDKEKYSKKKKKERKKHKKKKHKSRQSSYSSEEGGEEDEDEDEEDRESLKKAKLEALRAQRLQREAEESLRAKRVLAKLTGETLPEDKKPNNDPAVKQKYHSQFNPHLAKQNFIEDADMKKTKLK